MTRKVTCPDCDCPLARCGQGESRCPRCGLHREEFCCEDCGNVMLNDCVCPDCTEWSISEWCPDWSPEEPIPYAPTW